jgi:hypothetical protein
LDAAAALAAALAGAVALPAATAARANAATARRARPGLRADWCLDPGEPASLLPAGFTVPAGPAG